jgi:hypothetical protein
MGLFKSHLDSMMKNTMSSMTDAVAETMEGRTAGEGRQEQGRHQDCHNNDFGLLYHSHLFLL